MRPVSAWIDDCLGHTFRYSLGAVGIALFRSISVLWLPLVIKHLVAEQTGSSMPKNAKDMELNPNRDAQSSFSEGAYSNKQNPLDYREILSEMLSP